jgi:peptidoglycan biosynthesis protein MviN/MurJ (putative lipid II flippase)
MKFRQRIVHRTALVHAVTQAGAANLHALMGQWCAGAAASMSYAYILGLAPYGIIAGSVLTPLMRSLSTARREKQLPLLQVTVSSLALIMVPMAVLISSLAPHLVTVALSGGVFAATEVAAVARLLPLVQASALFGVVRDVLMRVHYVQGTAWRVLRLNVYLLVANLGLDILVLALGLGAYGLLAGTVIINVAACGLLWAAITGAPEKVSTVLACLRNTAITGVLAALSWLFASWASPFVFGVIMSCSGLSADGLVLGQLLSRSAAAVACAAFSLPMVLSYMLLYGGYVLFFKT